MSDADMSVAEVSLSPVLDLQAAEPLRAELLALRGRPLRVDASQVSRMGGLCLQVLLSARLSWAEDGLPLSVESPSESFLEQLAAFGAPQIDFEPEGANL
ncbi:MAG: STAS domain-containing protein [Caulobacteraceae bacterium]|nr:STAS domain-containing protein [Caulobacteraceae bacterium]MDX5392975.1 STAS domain-containing protein [Caulobacteraceae bacterium]